MNCRRPLTNAEIDRALTLGLVTLLIFVVALGLIAWARLVWSW